MSLNARLTIFKCRSTSPKPDAAAAAADEALQHQQPPRPVFKNILKCRAHCSQEQSGAQPCPWPPHANPVLTRSISVSSSIADNAAGSAVPDAPETQTHYGRSSVYAHLPHHAAAVPAALHSTAAVAAPAADTAEGFEAADAMDQDSDVVDVSSGEESEQLSGESDVSSDGYNTEDEEEENNSCCMMEGELHHEQPGIPAAAVEGDLQDRVVAAAAAASHSTAAPGTLVHHLSSSFSGSLQQEQQQQQQQLVMHKQQLQPSGDGSAAAAVVAELLRAHIPARVCCPVTPPASPAVDTAAVQQQQGSTAAAAVHGLPATPLAVHIAHAVQPIVSGSTVHLASPLVTTSRRGSTPSGRRGSTPGSWSQGLGRRAWAWLAGDIMGSPTATVAVTATPPPSPAVLQL